MSRVNHRLVRPCPNMSRAAAARRPVQFVTNPRVGMHDYARTLHITGPCSQKKKAAKIGSCTTERLEICAIGGSDILQRRALGEAAALLPLRTICSDQSFHLLVPLNTLFDDLTLFCGMYCQPFAVLTGSDSVLIIFDTTQLNPSQPSLGDVFRPYPCRPGGKVGIAVRDRFPH